MDIQYCFASSGGENIISDDVLSQPFLESAHVELDEFSLGAYFDSLKDFLLRDHQEIFLKLVQKVIPECVELNDIDRLIISSEKHGVLYHIACVQAWVGEKSVKYALSSTMTDEGKKCLQRDCRLLNNLINDTGPQYVPSSYFINEFIPEGKRNIHMLIAVLEWFEDYHEWHLSEVANKGDIHKSICVWDTQQGNYFLSERQRGLLIQKISNILTNYYCADTARQIYPWHHAAGDFIVKITGDSINVKLITIREYKVICGTDKNDPAAWIANIVRFFLHTSIRIRLDKLDGVGEPVWLDSFYVTHFITGFVKAYKEKFDRGDVALSVADFVSVLKMFGRDEMYSISQPLLQVYKSESETDYELIFDNVAQHLEELCCKIELL